MRSRLTGARCAAILFACALIVLAFTPMAMARGKFISAASRADMVYDGVRNVLYISSGSQVLRYHIKEGTFLTPLEVGGNLGGMDLSPDGNTLAVGDRNDSGSNTPSAPGEDWFYLINLNTGQVTKKTIVRQYGEGEVFSVAFAGDGKLLLTTTYHGSGWVPLRVYDPVTDSIKSVASSIRMDSMLCASADGSVVAWEESNSSGGSFARYKISDGSVLYNGTGSFNFDVAANRNGTQYSILCGSGAIIADAAMVKTGVKIGSSSTGYPVGAIYNPVKDIVYYSFSGTSKVRAYETATMTQVAEYDFESAFGSVAYKGYITGRLKTSRDGALLFATVPGGIRYTWLDNNPPVTAALSATTAEDTPVVLTPSGSDPEGNDVTFAVVTSPAHGTVVPNGNKMLYTPAADYYGSDSFTFKATDGDADSNAVTASITVTPVNDAPVANAQSVTAAEDKPVSITLTGKDAEGSILTYTIVELPIHGTLSGTAPNLVYSPDFDYSGSDSLKFKVRDGSLDSAVATVTIYVTPGPTPVHTTIGGAKRLPLGSVAWMQDSVVSAVGLESGAIFVESSDRSSGIKLLTGVSFRIGQRIANMKGYLDRVNGEWLLKECAFSGITDGAPLQPMYLSNKAIANDRQEKLVYTGINTTGLFVRACGRVTAVLPTQNVIYISDGSACSDGLGPWTGLRVQMPAGAVLPAKGRWVVINGISRVGKFALTQWGFINGEWYPTGTTVYVPSIWPRGTDDIQTVVFR